MRVAGTPSIPRAVEMYGARWFWPMNDGPAKFPRKNASTCSGRKCPFSKHFWPASTRQRPQVAAGEGAKRRLADTDNGYGSHILSV